MNAHWNTPPPPPRVLVAEDDDEIRALIVTVLRHDDYTVMEAGDGDELLAIVASPISRNPPDLIVSDVRLPGCSGLDAIETLREHDRITPILLVTAYLDGNVHDRARDLRVQRIFQKPFDLCELREEVLRLAPLKAFQYLKWPPRDVV
jgi:CheY-like chemotaxis protein